MSEWSGGEWARVLAEAARAIATQESVASTADEIAALAVTVVPGVDTAGVSRASNGKVHTLAALDELAGAVDVAQQELGEGPCLDAAWEDRTLLIDDMSCEKRWPRLAERARALGVHSLLACHLSSERGMRTALNLYSRQPHAFDESSVGIAVIYATHATIALDSARLESDLRAAVDSRQGIGQAVGILMERHRLTAKQAFDLLVRTSQQVNRKVRDLAGIIVATGIDPVSSSELARFAAVEARHRAGELRQSLLRTKSGRPVGSTPEQIEAAIRRAKAADARATTSRQRAVAAKLAAAEAHERAARFHEDKAAAGRADADAHDEQARMHRAAAAHARSEAERESAGPL
jgi:putative methionine-R-sulfoxide reductase with GAF domain